MRPTTGRFAVPSGDLRDQAQHPSAPAGRAARLRWSRRICSSLAAMAAPSPSQATWAMDIRCTSSQASRPRTSVSRRRRDAPPDGALAREVGSPPERRLWKIPSSVGSPSYASWPPGSKRRGGSARVEQAAVSLVSVSRVSPARRDHERAAGHSAVGVIQPHGRPTRGNGEFRQFRQ
jgi:hypothetical protein